MSKKTIVVIGGGIAGLTASALLAHEGFEVTLLEAHHQLGGCAGTFRRNGYVFDVGATQVAGLEIGGIHERIFRYLQFPLPLAEILDPVCEVNLCDGSNPIRLWHNPKKWKQERMEQFPGSEIFWVVCEWLHKSNWAFAGRDPVLPARSFWDIKKFLGALRFSNILSAGLSKSSVADLLHICSCGQDKRLQKFLNLQLKLYSQESIDCTSALYGATVLQMAQAPLGLWHLEGSMQELSENLLASFLRDGGQLRLKHRVIGLSPSRDEQLWSVKGIEHNKKEFQMNAIDVICTLPPQCLLDLLKDSSQFPLGYRNRLEQLSKPNGAIVFYGAVKREKLFKNCSSHFQIVVGEPLGSLFISVSRDNDGRAPIGEATVIASAFADIDSWNDLTDLDYQSYKTAVFEEILKELNSFFCITSKDWLHKELATPRSFQKWVGRPKGIVGGLGQDLFNFGPFGLPSRTPVEGLWLCGDSIYPGEGTAGVSQSALMVCRQLMASRGRDFDLPR